MVEDTWTVREALNWTRDYLRKGGIPAARFEAETLLAHAMEVERLQLYLQPDRILTSTERKRFRQLIERRRAGTPLQHLLGSVDFYNCRLQVNGHVLIPRPETEELVERVLADHQGRPLGHLLDLGTGSGAIAIALALARPDLQITASDCSVAALELARQNAMQNGVADRITFRCSDWFAELPGVFDAIVTNPPYVGSSEWAELALEVRAHEPVVALAGGTDGLAAIRRIVHEAPAHLRRDSHLYLEIGAGQAAAVQQLLEMRGAFTEVVISKDLAGHPRFVRARRT